MSFADAVRFYEEQVGMGPRPARAEAVKNSMFPCTAIMYWLGTQGIHDLRDEMKRQEGPRFSLRRFHGELLGYGSIPVTLVARMMTGDRPLYRDAKDSSTPPPAGGFARNDIRAALRGCARNEHRTRDRACGGDRGGGGPSNALLVVGYDREPDTMNRYATHILEDIQSCVVEGLTTNDEKMNVVPVLAAEIPTIQNGGVVMRPDGGMDVTWKLRPNVKWHDGKPHTSADVKFTVDAINKGDWKPESTDGFDRIASVDTPDSLTAVVHYKEVYAPYQMQFFRGTLPKHVLEGRDIDKANDYNRSPLAPAPIASQSGRRASTCCSRKVKDYWRGPEYPKIDRLLFRFLANTTTRINQLQRGEVHMVALVPWDKVRELRGLASVRLNQVLGNGYEHVTLNERHFPRSRTCAFDERSRTRSTASCSFARSSTAW
jgi:hypothetical protein